MNLPIDAAVYAEYSNGNKPMSTFLPPVGGWNIRVFNRVEAHGGESIGLDENTGVVSLKSGLYHITATSLVTYCDPSSEDQGVVPNSLNPYGGYCRLRHHADAGCPNDNALAIGTISSANMVPSTIETYLMLDADAEIVLEHQVGDTVKGIYLQVIAGNSTWHVFARIAIRRIQPS